MAKGPLSAFLCASALCTPAGMAAAQAIGPVTKPPLDFTVKTTDPHYQQDMRDSLQVTLPLFRSKGAPKSPVLSFNGDNDGGYMTTYDRMRANNWATTGVGNRNPNALDMRDRSKYGIQFRMTWGGGETSYSGDLLLNKKGMGDLVDRVRPGR